MNISNEPLALSVQETCQSLRLGKTMVYGLLARNALQRVKVGRRTLVTVSSIKALIASGEPPCGNQNV